MIALYDLGIFFIIAEYCTILKSFDFVVPMNSYYGVKNMSSRWRQPPVVFLSYFLFKLFLLNLFYFAIYNRNLQLSTRMFTQVLFSQSVIVEQRSSDKKTLKVRQVVVLFLS